RTTFYSTISRYRESFDTPIHTDKLQCNSVNTFPQPVGSAITCFKRYALVGHLNIRSEVDNDAAPNYNNYENRN
ncbi:ERF family protein, partial [Borreliella garinii]|uniref:ERF family protein n=1 Tax=Borreliella garinii TaxID=29519 RepID=UPI001AEFEC66